MSWLSELRVVLSAVAGLIAISVGLVAGGVFGVSVGAFLTAVMVEEIMLSLTQVGAIVGVSGVAGGVCFWTVAYLLRVSSPMTVAVSGAIREQKVSNR